MTDLLIAAILIVLLIQWHGRAKSTGWYGKLYVLITKRFKRFLKKMINNAINS